MNRLSEIRAERKMSKREMAKSLGVAYTTYCGWESGDRDLNSEKLSWLSSRLNVSVDYLVGRSEIRKPVTTLGDGQEENEENLLNADSLKRLMMLSPEELAKVDAFVQGLLASR